MNFEETEGSGKAGVDQHLVTVVCEKMMKILKRKIMCVRLMKWGILQPTLQVLLSVEVLVSRLGEASSR